MDRDYDVESVAMSSNALLEWRMLSRGNERRACEVELDVHHRSSLTSFPMAFPDPAWLGQLWGLHTGSAEPFSKLITSEEQQQFEAIVRCLLPQASSALAYGRFLSAGDRISGRDIGTSGPLLGAA